MLRNQYSYPVMSFGIETEADYMPDRASIVNAIGGVSYRLERPDAGVRRGPQPAGHVPAL